MDRQLRDFVWQRARGCCEYYLLPSAYDEVTFEIDHIIAEKHRGRTELDNLALACFSCNNHKGPNLSGIDPLTQATTVLFHPRLQNWRKHFRYDGAILTGITSEGRATVIVLEINLPHRVSHREALVEEGVFPPIGMSSS